MNVRLGYGLYILFGKEIRVLVGKGKCTGICLAQQGYIKVIKIY